MDRNEVVKYVNQMDANGLLELCENINEFKYQTGLLRSNCALNCLANDLHYFDTRDLEQIVLDAAHERFHNLVVLLIKSAPNKYIR